MNIPRAVEWLWVRKPTQLQLIMYLVMIASTPHLASAFGSLEYVGDEWRGWMAAIAFDGGVIVLERAISRASPIGIIATIKYIVQWLILIIFVSVAVFARIDQAVGVLAAKSRVSLSDFATIDSWQFAKVILMAGILPIVIVGLAFTGDKGNTAKVAIVRSGKRRQGGNNDNDTPKVTIDKVTDGKLLPPPNDMPNELAEAIAIMWQHRSYRKAEAASGVNRETLRQRVKLAERDYPDYTKTVLSA